MIDGPLSTIHVTVSQCLHRVTEFAREVFLSLLSLGTFLVQVFRKGDLSLFHHGGSDARVA